jgi:hypothetical protein
MRQTVSCRSRAAQRSRQHQGTDNGRDYLAHLLFLSACAAPKKLLPNLAFRKLRGIILLVENSRRPAANR